MRIWIIFSSKELNYSMEIKGKVHCFFEQSGTFKNEFIKLGIHAEDYDIQNNFGQTDHVIDLFGEIEKGYKFDGSSIFDTMSKDDLVLAFFPCIKFCTMSAYNQMYKGIQMREQGIPLTRVYDFMKKESDERYKFYQLALKMYACCEIRGVRLIMENPWHTTNYTNFHWFYPVSYIDTDRSRRGDFFKKPTAYWFVGCSPCDGFTWQQTPKNLIKSCGAGGSNTKARRGTLKLKGIVTSKSSGVGGLCSEERSMISPDYARNFICDQILGLKQDNNSKNLQYTIF